MKRITVLSTLSAIVTCLLLSAQESQTAGYRMGRALSAHHECFARRGLLIAAGGTGVTAGETSVQEPVGKGAATKPEVRRLRHKGKDRTYLIRVPKRLGGERYPVILLLHPAASTGQIVWDQTSLPRIARENRAILVAPDGLNRTWNTYYWKKGSLDDVGFLTYLLDTVIAEERGDPERIYVTGMSAGAGMTFALAWTIGDRLAAIGPVANNLGKDQRDQPMRLTKPLPVVHIMGDKDTHVSYNGGKVFGIWPVLSAKDTIAFWVKHNRCRPEPTVERLPDTNAADNSQVIKSSYRGAAPVVHYRIKGGGHTWPNGPDDALGRLLFGQTNRDMDSGTVLWEFFRDKRRRSNR
jgi:polyhydroxybutyrate depolymerase